MANSLPLDGESLAEKFPEVAREWHPTLNGDLTAQDVKPFSQIKRWWQCASYPDHAWQAAVGNRVQGRGCPICGGKQVLVGFNDLATKYPEVASQWHPTKNGDLTPQDVTAGTSTKVWWKCPVAADHEWQATVAMRTGPSTGTGCAVCAGRVVVPSTSLAVLYPDTAAQWHPTKNGDVTPSDVTPTMTKKVWWRCEQNHEWSASIQSRASRGANCPMCSGRNPIVGETDLATTHPDVSNEWHPTKNGDLSPTQLKAGSNNQVWWQCSQGHEWRTAPVNRTNLGSGCPYCAGQRAIVGVNDLETTHPELSTEWHPTKNGNLTPKDVMAGTDRKVWWICSLGHEWAAPTYNRVNVQSGCPVCANKAVLPGFNDLATINPTLASQWHPIRNQSLTASDVTPSSAKKIWWICSIGHEWQATVANRASGQGCPICSNKQILAGFNDLSTTDPNLSQQWHQSKNPTIHPTEVTRFSNKKVWWRCEENHEWISTVANRSAGFGCPSCAETGYNPGKNGWLYFLEHHGWSMFQIGITNVPQVRLANHARNGWEVREIRGPMDGALTASLEREGLQALARRGAILGKRGNASAFDGFTESWSRTSLELSSIQQLMDWIYEDESVPEIEI